MRLRVFNSRHCVDEDTDCNGAVLGGAIFPHLVIALAARCGNSNGRMDCQVAVRLAMTE
jgi:hypothetical protein